MQQAFSMQNFDYGRRKQHNKKGFKAREQTYGTVQVPYFFPQVPMQPYMGMNQAGPYKQPQTNGKAVHPPEYKELYKLWQKLQNALSASERKQVFQLCEQAHNFKVESKIKNAFIVLQNTFAQMLERVASKQMQLEENLDNLAPQGENNTPPLLEEKTQIQASAGKIEEESSEQKELPQQQSVDVQEIKEAEEEENMSSEEIEEVVNAGEAQQQIDEFGLTQQMQIQRLCEQIQTHKVEPQKMRTVIEQIALMGRRQSSGLNNESDGRTKSIKNPIKDSKKEAQLHRPTKKEAKK